MKAEQFKEKIERLDVIFCCNKNRSQLLIRVDSSQDMAIYFLYRHPTHTTQATKFV